MQQTYSDIKKYTYTADSNFTAGNIKPSGYCGSTKLMLKYKKN